MAPESGDVVVGVGKFIPCPECGGDGWIDPIEFSEATKDRILCPTCQGRPVLLDDGAVPLETKE